VPVPLGSRAPTRSWLSQIAAGAGSGLPWSDRSRAGGPFGAPAEPADRSARRPGVALKLRASCRREDAAALKGRPGRRSVFRSRRCRLSNGSRLAGAGQSRIGPELHASGGTKDTRSAYRTSLEGAKSFYRASVKVASGARGRAYQPAVRLITMNPARQAGRC
jgi:hypothetical protein